MACPISAATKRICVICQDSLLHLLHEMSDGLSATKSIPTDYRLLFYPVLCHHEFHLACARSQAKSDVLEGKDVLRCPICRQSYGEEDLRRLLPAERLLQVRVRPADENSEFELKVWEHYDPACHRPEEEKEEEARRRRNRSTYAFLDRQVFHGQYDSINLPLFEEQYSVPARFSTAASPSWPGRIRAPSIFLEVLQRDRLQQFRRESWFPMWPSRRDDIASFYKIRRWQRQQSGAAALLLREPDAAFQQIVAAHGVLFGALHAFDEAVYQLRLVHELNPVDRRNSILSEMERKLRIIEENFGHFISDFLHLSLIDEP